MNNGGPQSRTSLTLMQQLRANPRDSDAWSTFLHTYGPRIDAWCRRWKLQEADVQDVTQNVLLKLAKQFVRFEYNPDSSFRSWLRTVTEHALSDFVATHKQTNTVTSVPNVLFSQEARREFLDRLSESFDLEVLAEARTRVQVKVDPMHWQVFELMADESMSGAETAEHLGISVANAFAIKSRVQKLIRQEISFLDEGEAAHG